MNRGFVVRACFRIARTQRHMERSTDLFVEEDVAREALDIEIRSDGIFPDVTRALIRFKHLEQVVLILFCLRSLYSAAVEGQLCAFHAHASINSGVRKLHPTIDRVFHRSSENFTV